MDYVVDVLKFVAILCELRGLKGLCGLRVRNGKLIHSASLR
jgi:hypothetical protein